MADHDGSGVSDAIRRYTNMWGLPPMPYECHNCGGVLDKSYHCPDCGKDQVPPDYDKLRIKKLK